MTETLSVTLSADIYRERINELGDHGMNEKITLFEIIDQLLHVISLRRYEILFLLNTGRVRNVVTFRNCHY